MQSFRVLLLAILVGLLFFTGCESDPTPVVTCSADTPCEKDTQECEYLTLTADKGVCVDKVVCEDNDGCVGRNCNDFNGNKYCGSTGDFSIKEATLPDATVNEVYVDVTLEVENNNGENYFFLKDGAGTLPNGLKLSDEGVISGTATGEVKDYTFTVVAVNAAKNAAKFYNVRQAEREFSITLHEENLCKDVTCNGVNEECNMDDGECVCSTGFLRNVNTEICETETPCTTTQCSGFTECVVEDNAGLCVCSAGYQDNDENGTCKKDCDTAALTCSTHMECSDAEGLAECVCSEGYAGDTCTDCADGFHAKVEDATLCENNLKEITCTNIPTDDTVAVWGEAFTDGKYTQTWDETTSTFLPAIAADACGWKCLGQNMVHNVADSVCECPEGLVSDDNGGCKETCADNQLLGEDGYCKCYPGYATPEDATDSKCTDCAEGYKTSNGMCVIDCTGNSMANEAGDACICKDGFFGDDCVDPCSLDDATECNANEKCVGFENAGTVGTTCECDTSKGFTDGPNDTCICGTDATDNNGTCECDADFHAVEGSVNCEADQACAADSCTEANKGVCSDTGGVIVCSCDEDAIDEDGVCTLPTELAGSDTCGEDPMVTITEAGYYSGTTVGYTNDYLQEVSCVDEDEDGNDVVYAVTVPANTKLKATLTTSSASDWIILYLLTSCDPLECGIASNHWTSRSPEDLEYTNDTDAEVTYFLVIDSDDADNTLDYVLNIEFESQVELTCDPACSADDHKVCAVIDGEATCVCDGDNGYVDNGYVCVDMCSNITCGDNAHCEATDAVTAPTCECDEGAKLLEEGVCVIPQENSGTDTCLEAQTITSGFYTGTTVGTTDELGACTDGEQAGIGGDTFYKIVVTSENTSFFAYLSSPGWNSTLRLLKESDVACEFNENPICKDDRLTSEAIEYDSYWYEYYAIHLEPGTYYLVVDGKDNSEGTFELKVLLGDPCAENTCNTTSEKCVATGFSDNKFECDCAEGYFEDDNGVCVTPCDADDAPTCNTDGHETCIGETIDEAVCGCETGYLRTSETECELPPECEDTITAATPNHDSATAAALTLTGRTTAFYLLTAVDSVDDGNGGTTCNKFEDWYKVTLEAGDKITVDLEFKNSEGDLDLYLYLDTTDLDYGWLDRGFTSSDNETATYTVKATDIPDGETTVDFYIRTTLYGNATRNNYNMFVTVGKVCDTNEECVANDNGEAFCIVGMCEATDPCATATCTDATCEATSGTEFVCNCNDGFFKNENDVCVDPCATAEACTDTNSTCEATSLTETSCVCNENFFEDDNGLCVNPCEGANAPTCADADHLECVSTDATTAECQCVDSYEMNDTTCQACSDTITDSGDNSTYDTAAMLTLTDVETRFENLSTANSECVKAEDWYKVEGLVVGDIIKVDLEFIDDNGDIDLGLYIGGDEYSNRVGYSGSSNDNESAMYTIKASDIADGENSVTLYIRAYFGKNFYNMVVAKGNPCTVDSCGDNSECVATSPTEFDCNCNDGFFEDDSDPVECVTPCVVDACGDNSECVATSATEFDCNCNDGFFKNDSDVCVDPCLDANAPTCDAAEHKVCVATDATTATCECMSGYFDADGTCVEDHGADKCDSDDIYTITETGSYVGTTVGFTNDYTNEATLVTEGYINGHDVVYAIELMDGAELNVELEQLSPLSTTTGNPTGYVITYLKDECTMESSVATSGNLTETAPVSFNYTNNTGATKTYFIVVDRYGSTDMTYSLNVDITNPAPTGTLFFSEYIEGGGSNKVLEIYNATSADVDLSEYYIIGASNAGPITEAIYNLSGNLVAGEVFVVCNDAASDTIKAECDLQLSSNATDNILNFNGNDARALVKVDANGTVDLGDGVMGTTIDQIGLPDENATPSNFDVAGVAGAGKDHTLVRKSSVTSGDMGDWTTSAGTDANDSEWIVLPKDDLTGLGSHND